MRLRYLGFLLLLGCAVTTFSDYRIWNTADGKSVEAEFVMVMATEVVLKDLSGKNYKIKIDQLSEEDRLFIALENVPKFDLSFKVDRSQRIVDMGPYIDQGNPVVFDYRFGVDVRQKQKRAYPHELKIEYFAIGEEVIGKKFIMLEHNTSSFTPSPENKGSHFFKGNRITTRQYEVMEQTRGRKYGGYLILLIDSRNQIIQYESSYSWIREMIAKGGDELDLALAQLREIPQNMFFDKSFTRVRPTRPQKNY